MPCSEPRRYVRINSRLRLMQPPHMLVPVIATCCPCTSHGDRRDRRIDTACDDWRLAFSPSRLAQSDRTPPPTSVDSTSRSGITRAGIPSESSISSDQRPAAPRDVVDTADVVCRTDRRHGPKVASTGATSGLRRTLPPSNIADHRCPSGDSACFPASLAACSWWCCRSAYLDRDRMASGLRNCVISRSPFAPIAA